MTDLAGRILKAWLAEGRDARLPLDNLADTAASVAREEIMRLRHICKTISTGLRGQYASREDMWKLAESAEVE